MLRDFSGSLDHSGLEKDCLALHLEQETEGGRFTPRKVTKKWRVLDIDLKEVEEEATESGTNGYSTKSRSVFSYKPELNK